MNINVALLVLLALAGCTETVDGKIWRGCRARTKAYIEAGGRVAPSPVSQEETEYDFLARLMAKHPAPPPAPSSFWEAEFTKRCVLAARTSATAKLVANTEEAR